MVVKSVTNLEDAEVFIHALRRSGAQRRRQRCSRKRVCSSGDSRSRRARWRLPRWRHVRGPHNLAQHL